MESKTWSTTFSYKSQYLLTLTVTEQSVDIPNNKSTVAYSLVMSTTPNSYVSYSNYKTTISLKIDGTTVYSYEASRNFNYPSVQSSYTETLASGTRIITHGTNGAYSLPCVASVTVAGSSSDPYSPGSASISQSMNLTVIPRASTCDLTGLTFTIGSPTVITIARADNSFQHKLKFTVGSASETVPSGSYASTSYSWTPASGTYASQFPTQTARSGTLVLYTYSGSTLIGSNSYSFTLNIPSGWKPTISASNITLSPYSQNAFVSSNSLYVAGYSQIDIAATATASSGTTISSWTISGAVSATKSGSYLSYRSGIIASSGTKTITVTVTDARGRSASASKSVSFLSYTVPAVSTISYNRGSYVGGSWTSSNTGTDLRVTFKANCSLSSQGNAMTYSATVVTVNSSGSVSNNGTKQMYKTGIGTTTAYTVTVTLTDTVGNSVSRSVYVPTIEIPFVIDPALPAIGVGAIPQTARVLELASNWQINPGSGIVAKWTTQDILNDALTMPTGSVQYYYGAGASYTGSVPGDYTAYKYGLFVAYRRSSTYCTVIAVPFNSNYGIGINTYNDNNSAWDGWQTFEQAGKLVTEDKTYSTATTLAAGAHATVNITVTKAGYTPIGIIGVTWSGSGYLSLCGYKITSSTNAALYVVNRGTSSQTANSYTATILYQRS